MSLRLCHGIPPWQSPNETICDFIFSIVHVFFLTHEVVDHWLCTIHNNFQDDNFALRKRNTIHDKDRTAIFSRGFEDARLQTSQTTAQCFNLSDTIVKHAVMFLSQQYRAKFRVVNSNGELVTRFQFVCHNMEQNVSSKNYFVRRCQAIYSH